MRVIGLTGGIASGKSTVSKELRKQGAFIIDADEIARRIVEPGQPALAELQVAFGPEILLADGTLNRKKIGSLVFGDPKALERLNGITHSRIKLEVLKDIEKAASAGYNIVVLDVPLLIEAGWQSMADEIWVVYVDEQTQLKRLMDRDRLGREDALARLRAQMSLEEKKDRADVLVDNRGTLEETRNQIAKGLTG